MAKMYGKGKTAIESEEQAKLRWQVELEFVQCLANPNYLNFLAQRGYFKDQTFINYLKYLQYWKEPEYAKYLMYPLCLYFLDLLQYEHFRREIVNSQCCKFIDDQTILQWQHYTRKRIKLFNSVNTNQMGTITGTAEGNEPSLTVQQSTQSSGGGVMNGTNNNNQQAQQVSSQSGMNGSNILGAGSAGNTVSGGINSSHVGICQKIQ